MLGTELPSSRLPSSSLRLTNAVAYVVLIAVNVLSNTGLLGATNAEISALYPTPLTPAGWAFSIWGVIFFLEGCGVVYQLLPFGYRENTWTKEIVTAIGTGWQAGWYLQCAWQLAFVQHTKLTLWLCIFFLLASLYMFLSSLLNIYSFLEARKQNIPFHLFLLFLLPTSINAAWLSVASSIGILIVPVAYDVSQAELQPIASILAIVVSIIGLYFLIKKRDAAYGFTLTWALVAVYANHLSPWIKTTSLAGIVVLSMFSMLALTRKRSTEAVEADDDFEHVHDVLLNQPEEP